MESFNGIFSLEGQTPILEKGFFNTYVLILVHVLNSDNHHTPDVSYIRGMVIIWKSYEWIFALMKKNGFVLDWFCRWLLPQSEVSRIESVQLMMTNYRFCGQMVSRLVSCDMMSQFQVTTLGIRQDHNRGWKSNPERALISNTSYSWAPVVYPASYVQVN